MATHFIYLKEEFSKPKRLGTSLNTSYNYVYGRLNVFWHGVYSSSVPAKIGEAYQVLCQGKAPVIVRASLPSRNSHLMVWLAGFTVRTTASSEAEYHSIVASKFYQYDLRGYATIEVAAPGWKYMIAEGENGEGLARIACLVEDDPTKKTVRSFLESYGVDRLPYHRSYVRETLAKRFGFAQAELDEFLPTSKG